MKIFELSLFGFTIAPTYYGLMYALTFLYGIYYVKKLGKYTDSQRESLFYYILLGVILGGRLGYIFFYNFTSYLNSPLDVFKVWEGGMSFHGGALGMSLAVMLFARRNKLKLWSLADDLARIVPIGLFFGRIGNYINKELLGFPYNGFLAVTTSQGTFFPSPLLEALLEGAILYFILNYISQKKKFDGAVIAGFFVFYALFRILIEIFIRTPDIQLGYYFGFLTQGSLLSIPMMLFGIGLYYTFSRKV